MTVNNRKNFKDPIAGAHKNIVECFWNSAKAQICLRNTPEAIAKNFAEFIFKRHNNNDEIYTRRKRVAKKIRKNKEIFRMKLFLDYDVCSVL